MFKFLSIKIWLKKLKYFCQKNSKSAIFCPKKSSRTFCRTLNFFELPNYGTKTLTFKLEQSLNASLPLSCFRCLPSTAFSEASSFAAGQRRKTQTVKKEEEEARLKRTTTEKTAERGPLVGNLTLARLILATFVSCCCCCFCCCFCY